MNPSINQDVKNNFEAREIAYSSEVQIRNQKALLELRERKEYLDQRKTWSIALLIVILLLVLFTFLFTLEVGVGNWAFKDEWLVRLVYVTFFASIIGLANIVVNFLFPKKQDETIQGINEVSIPTNPTNIDY